MRAQDLAQKRKTLNNPEQYERLVPMPRAGKKLSAEKEQKIVEANTC